MAGLDLLRGTLDLLILRSVSAGPKHGYAIARWIESVSEGDFLVEEGSLYPALQRIRGKGWLDAEWGVSDTGRRARFYELTPAGADRLKSELRAWERYTQAVARAMEAEVVP
ncbi:MAG: PadR family transcriptional regulator [Longimicrobiales bacterium]|nr:PadR family transcriptional regulator [Longimicrobiales bacterium]